MNKDYFSKRLEEKHSSRIYDYSQLPEEFLATDKVAIGCEQHGLFYQKVASHLHGSGCPKCGQEQNLKRLLTYAGTTESFVKKSRERFGDRFNYDETSYEHQNTPVKLVCVTHGAFEIKPSAHFRLNYGCGKCDRENRLRGILAKNIDLARKHHNDKYDYSEVGEFASNEKVKIGCPVHGWFYQVMCFHAIQGHGCLACARDSWRMNIEKFTKKANEVHKNFYSYDNVKLSGYHEKVQITCPKHGNFFQRPNSHLSGNGCKDCFQESKRGNTENFIAEARKIHGDTYDCSKVKYKGNKVHVELVCKKHGSFWVKPNSHLSNRSGCRFCYESKGEKAVEVFLQKHGIKFMREHRLSPTLLRCDFFLPDQNLVIEFHGQQHHHPVELFGGKEGFRETIQRDKKKAWIIHDLGWRLVVLNYKSLKNNTVEEDLIAGLKSVLNYWCKVDNKVLAFRNIVQAGMALGLPQDMVFSEYEKELSLKPGLQKLF